jgi:spore germination cell wall hydrolase CwlJ-like protein
MFVAVQSSRTNKLVMLVAGGAATLIVLGTGVYQWSNVTEPALVSPSPAPPTLKPPPAVQPSLLQPLKPEEAILVNAARPLDISAGPAAKPFALGQRAPAFKTALECLTSAVYYEAASEPLDGQRAVAQVVLNRVRHPAFPASVCAVVYQGAERRTGCQFSFTCDGSLSRPPAQSYWKVAKAVAEAALSGAVYAPVGNATHYHADWVLPYWASSLNKSAAIGRHIFYRWKGFWGEPSSFRQRYSGAERKPNLDVKLDVLAPSTEALGEPVISDASDLIVHTTEKVPIAAEQLPIQPEREPRPALLADTTAGKLIANLDPGGAPGVTKARSRADASVARADPASNCPSVAQARPIGAATAKIEASPALASRC